MGKAHFSADTYRTQALISNNLDVILTGRSQVLAEMISARAHHQHWHKTDLLLTQCNIILVEQVGPGQYMKIKINSAFSQYLKVIIN